MLKIEQVERYTIARYPARRCYRAAPSLCGNFMKGSAASLVMLAILESCDGNGMTGPPPVPPEMITENEARQVIERVFSDSSITMTNDVPHMVHFSNGDSAGVTLDGFNESLQVGYEYLAGDDFIEYTVEVRHALDSLMNENGPYIETVFETQWESNIEDQIEAFIDTLKANGVI